MELRACERGSTFKVLATEGFQQTEESKVGAERLDFQERDTRGLVAEQKGKEQELLQGLS